MYLAIVVDILLHIHCQHFYMLIDAFVEPTPFTILQVMFHELPCTKAQDLPPTDLVSSEAKFSTYNTCFSHFHMLIIAPCHQCIVVWFLRKDTRSVYERAALSVCVCTCACICLCLCMYVCLSDIPYSSEDWTNVVKWRYQQYGCKIIILAYCEIHLAYTSILEFIPFTLQLFTPHKEERVLFPWCRSWD